MLQVPFGINETRLTEHPLVRLYYPRHVFSNQHDAATNRIMVPLTCGRTANALHKIMIFWRPLIPLLFPITHLVHLAYVI